METKDSYSSQASCAFSRCLVIVSPEDMLKVTSKGCMYLTIYHILRVLQSSQMDYSIQTSC